MTTCVDGRCGQTGCAMCRAYTAAEACNVCGAVENARHGEWCTVLHQLKPANTTTHDPVNHPKHYTAHPSGVECITVTEHFNFNTGNAIKYLWRSEHKNGLEDLRKAAWYLNREIARREKESK